MMTDTTKTVLIVVLVGLLTMGLLTFVVANTHSCQETCTFHTRAYIPAHYHDWTSWHCISYNKKGYCTLRVPIHHHDFIPDEWTLTFIDKKGDRHSEGTSKDLYENPPKTIQHNHVRWGGCEK